METEGTLFQHSLSFPYRARYFTLGKVSPLTKEIWFVLHGYGQLASYFIKKFNALAQNNIFVIAPEGLSRFYLDDIMTRQSGQARVGASWMTRENREMEIENYLVYLDTLFSTAILPPVPITLLGFSQGASTVSRWAVHGNVRFDRLVLWGGYIAPDLDFQKGHDILRKKEVLFVYGKDDPFLNKDRQAEAHMLHTKLNVPVKEIVFDGKHEIHEGTLKSLIEQHGVG